MALAEFSKLRHFCREFARPEGPCYGFRPSPNVELKIIASCTLD